MVGLVSPLNKLELLYKDHIKTDVALMQPMQTHLNVSSKHLLLDQTFNAGCHWSVSFDLNTSYCMMLHIDMFDSGS